jgi:hypothetical protein
MAAFKTDDPKLWVEFFASQHGGGGFIGDPFQRGGFSLGSLFKGLARVALPVLKRAGKSVAKQALQTGMEVANDTLSGKNIGQAIEERGKVGAKKLLKKGNKAMAQPKRKRKPQQKGGMSPGTFKNIGKGVLPLNIKGRRNKKDVLGTYFMQ